MLSSATGFEILIATTGKTKQNVTIYVSTYKHTEKGKPAKGAFISVMFGWRDNLEKCLNKDHKDNTYKKR